MKKLRMVAIVIFLYVVPFSLGTIWTETFDDGYGRLSHTTDNGAEKYIWNPSEGVIDGEFVRYSHENRYYDRRYASLGGNYEIQSASFAFSAVFTPTDRSWSYYSKSANIGFLGDSTGGFPSMLSVGFSNRQTSTFPVNNYFTIMTTYSDGSYYTSFNEGVYLDYSWGTTYYIDFLYDNTNHLAYASLYEGISSEGLFIGTISTTVDPSKNLYVNGLGLTNGDGNTISQSYKYITRGQLEEISLISIPEPASMLLLLLGGLALRKRN